MSITFAKLSTSFYFISWSISQKAGEFPRPEFDRLCTIRFSKRLAFLKEASSLQIGEHDDHFYKPAPATEIQYFEASSFLVHVRSQKLKRSLK
jgi:hypothetical protein